MNEERAKQGMEHLQAAAIEVISAMRAFLDVAEDVVRDPSAAAELASSLLDQARPATAPAPVDGDEPRVTRIRVS
ncbi:MAG: hypothetical protein M3Q68_07715 [Actinomycetota bacterium]|nr:hypothetical protein [Actinomycetota bacterium]